MEKTRLSKRPTRIQRTRKRTAKQIERDDDAREAAMRDFPPKPVSLGRKIAARLKNIREREGISLAVLSERTGITRANLCRFENSSDDFRVSTLKQYADALGVPVKLFLGDDVLIFSARATKSEIKSMLATEKRSKPVTTARRKK